MSERKHIVGGLIRGRGCLIQMLRSHIGRKIRRVLLVVDVRLLSRVHVALGVVELTPSLIKSVSKHLGVANF